MRYLRDIASNDEIEREKERAPNKRTKSMILKWVVQIIHPPVENWLYLKLYDTDKISKLN